MAPRNSKKKSAPQLEENQVIQLVDLADLIDQVAHPLLDLEEDQILDKAKEVYYKACEAPSKKQRLALARKAIEISPLCADAFVLLAEHETWASDAQLALYRQAANAGKKAIGNEFEELTGEFWGFIETRPFMRAKLGLAVCLWERNEREEALQHLRDMLVLNPNDNQGVRDILAAYLLEERLHEELAALLKAHKNDASANLGFSRALLAFRLHGDGAKPRKMLSAALAQNQHVPQYITGGRKLPESLPPYYSPGDNSEAVHYAADFKKGWDETPGAIDWLRNFEETPKKQAASRKKKAAKSLNQPI